MPFRKMWISKLPHSDDNLHLMLDQDAFCHEMFVVNYFEKIDSISLYIFYRSSILCINSSRLERETSSRTLSVNSTIHP